MALTKGFARNAGTDAIDARFMEAGRLVRRPDGTPRLGVLYNPDASANVLYARAAMTIGIPDQLVLAVSRGVGDGATILVNNGGTEVPVTAPTSNSWYVVIWAKQNDSTAGDANDLPVFGTTYSPAAASPSLATATAAVPTGALILGNVLIPSAATATTGTGVVVTSTNNYTALLGGTIRYRSNAGFMADIANVTNGTFGQVDLGATGSAGVYVARNGRWTRIDGLPLGIAEGSGTKANNTTTAVLDISGSVARYNVDPVYFTTRADGLLQVAVAGWYMVTGNVQWGTNGTGNRFSAVYINNAPVPTAPIGDVSAGQSAGAGLSGYSGLVLLAAGDVLSLQGWQNSGGSLAFVSRLSAMLVQATA